ncbi:MAG: hypothetical protein J3R72DRAFT_489190 [Linnemannia gamsii]|nr:MAG: hypothetical protein J3R72DRAFT_489190 [Linnemannia gamsii]
MSYKDHVADRNASERVKAAGNTIPSGAKRSLSFSTRGTIGESSPLRADSNNDDTAHSSPTDDFSQPPVERETSSCTICLNTYEDRAVLESCHHEFCFSCILQWSTLSHTCPLCIRPFTSCMHEIKNNEEYAIHQFEPLPRARSSSGSTAAGNTSALPHGIIRRLYGPPQWRRRTRDRPPPRIIPDSADELSVSDRQQAALENRRNVYRNNLFVRHMGANKISGFQQTTPESFSIFPHRLDRLVPWIRRELQAITTLSSSSASQSALSSDGNTVHSANSHDETDPGLEIIREYIIAVCKRYDLQTDQGQDLIRDFLYDHTEHFVHELMAFARSPFSIEAYDRVAQYGPHSSSSSTSTSATVAEEGDNRPIINSQNSTDQERQRRRRRHDSPENSDYARRSRIVAQSEAEERSDRKKSRRKDYDYRDARSYSRSLSRESTIDMDGTRSRGTSSKEAYYRERGGTGSSRNEEGSSSPSKATLLTKQVQKGKSSTSTPSPMKADLQTILLAKLKREQDLYHASRNSNTDPPLTPLAPRPAPPETTQ